MELRSATEKNRALYDSFWKDVPDFSKYNPGARHRRRLALKTLSEGGFASLLDVGCGNGELLSEIARIHPHASLAGADLAPSQIDANRKQFPQIEFYTLDIQRAAMNRTFDRVICCEVIEHLDDQPAAVRHLAAMTRAGGQLIITCPTGTLYATEKFFGHVRHPTADELIDEGKAAGLRPLYFINWGWPTYRLLKWATNVNSEWALRTFANKAYSSPAKFVSTCLFWLNYLNLPRATGGCQLVAVFQKD